MDPARVLFPGSMSSGLTRKNDRSSCEPSSKTGNKNPVALQEALSLSVSLRVYI